MKARKHKNKIGMTLIEVILAMAILSLVVILMTPVLVSGFNMITLSGNRHVNAKNVAGEVENNLAGETVTASLHDVSIELPGGIVVGGKSYTLDQGSGARKADLDGYIIDSIPFFDPTSPSTTATNLTSEPTGSTETSSSTDPTTETSETSTPGSTTTPTESPISLTMVTVDVSDWRNDALAVNRYGILQGTTSAMEYQIRSFDGSILDPNWITCGESQTEIFLSDHNQGYQVVVRQRTNHANNKHLRIRSAPLVSFHKQGQKVTFYIWDSNNANWRKIVNNDQIELLLSHGGAWILVTSGLELKHIDTSYIYARYAAGANSETGNITDSDPPSFPRRVGSK